MFTAKSGARSYECLLLGLVLGTGSCDVHPSSSSPGTGVLTLSHVWGLVWEGYF